MICEKCKVNTAFTHPFVRMNPVGKDGIFWCEPCAEKHEPELYRNQKEDEGEVEKFLKEIMYGEGPGL